MAKLIVLSDEEPREIELEASNSLGRHPSSSIHLADPGISKNHCEIVRTADERYVLRDLGSTNGTWVRGERVGEHRLAHGDEILVGSTRMLFQDDAANEAQAALQSVVLAAQDVQMGPPGKRVETRAVKEFRPEQEVQDLAMLRGDYERLRIAHELSRDIGTELDLDRLLHKILDKAFEMLPADRGVILLVDEEGNNVPRIAKRRGGGSVDEIVISSSIVNHVMEEKMAVLCSDAMLDERFAGAQSIAFQGMRSTMCVPLVHHAEVFGIMHLDTLEETGVFTEKDLQIFSSIASQAALAVYNAQVVARNEWEARTRARFQRFFSPDLVQQLMEGNLQLDAAGQTREVTCLFADIRGFTAMTEDADAHDIVRLLNEYFEVMVDVIFKYHGSLDKYVGDEIMALFGVPAERPGAATDAVTCGLAMMEALEAFNVKRRAKDLQPVAIGIGINSGPCVYGALGSSKTLQYTVIGDPVNTAARLCSVAKGGEVIISEDTYAKTSEFIDAVPLPKVRVKGKKDELSIYRLVRVKDPTRPDSRTIPPI